MANFCTRCGRPLPENGICSCSVNETGAAPIRPESSVTGNAQGQPGAGQPNAGQSQPGAGRPNAAQGQPTGGRQGQPYGAGYQGQPNGGRQGQPYGGPGYQGQPYGGPGYQGQPTGGRQGQPYGGPGYQGQPNGGPGYQGQPPYGQPYPNQGRTKEAEWLNEKKDALISGTKNMFAEILPVLKAPVSRIKQIAASGNPAVGLEFVIAKTVLVILIVLIALMRLRSAMGMAADYVKIPYFRILFAVLLLTAGVDCLEALLLKVFTKVFNGVTNFASMISVIGGKALYEGLVFLVGALFLLLSPGTASILILLGFLIFPYIEFGEYMAVAQLNDDRKPYVFFVVKICMMIVLIVIAYIFINDIVSSLVGGGIGDLIDML